MQSASRHTQYGRRHRTRLGWGGLLLLALLAMLPALLPALGLAQQGPPEGTPAAGAQAGISLEQATAIVRARYNGRILSAAPARRGNDAGYRVRVLQEDGRVITVFVDSQGRIR